PDYVFHQISRRPNWVTRAPLPELRTASTPSPPIEFGLLGLLNTLKKSTLNRTETRSLNFTNLNNDASWNHCRTPGRYWFRQGWRLSLNVVRCTVPLFNGTQTVLVSQNCDTTVPAGALAGMAVEPPGHNGWGAGL